jgi:cytochrome c oxidase subunit II
MKQRFLVCFSVFVSLFCVVSAIAQSSTPRRIEIHARRFSFIPAEITVEKGEPVTLALTSDDVPHSLLLDGLHINAPVTKGHFTEVTITPDAAGDFKGRCGRFCGSGHGSMLFVVHVVER